MTEPQCLCIFTNSLLVKIMPVQFVKAEYGYDMEIEKVVSILNAQASYSVYKIRTLDEILEEVSQRFLEEPRYDKLKSQIETIVNNLKHHPGQYYLSKNYHYEVKKKVFLAILKLSEEKNIRIDHLGSDFLEVFDYSKFTYTLDNTKFKDDLGKTIYLTYASLKSFRFTYKNYERDIFGDPVDHRRFYISEDLYEFGMMQFFNDALEFSLTILKMALNSKQRFESEPILSLQIAMCYFRLGKPKQAETYIDRALNSSDHYPDPVLISNWAATYKWLKDDVTCLKKLREFLMNVPIERRTRLIEGFENDRINGRATRKDISSEIFDLIDELKNA